METIANKKTLFLILIFFFIFFTSSLLVILVPKQSQQKKLIVSPTSKSINMLTESNFKGKLFLKGEEKYLLANEFFLELIVDSKGENITAFDVILDYDQGLEFVKVESLDENFDVFTNKMEKDFLTVGKKTNARTVFQDQSVLKIYFQGKKPGKYQVKILPAAGNLTTKLVNDKTEVVKPKINSIYLELE